MFQSHYPSTASDALIGRGREMAELTIAFERAMSGQGRMVMLAGEPGIGKTRLAGELAALAHERGAQVLWGGCYENGGFSLPYLPFVEVLRSYLLSPAGDALPQEMGSNLAELARIVPVTIRVTIRVVLIPINYFQQQVFACSSRIILVPPATPSLAAAVKWLN